MSQVFPLRSAVSLEDREPRLVELNDEVADDVFEALSARTTRRIFAALHDEPRTASDLAEVTDTSVQNVQYHIGKLADAELVEGVDTWYSERGTEMTVYAPSDEALVLFAGGEERTSLRSVLKRALGAVGLLGVVSLVVALVADRLVTISGTGAEGADAGAEAGPAIAADGAESTGGVAGETARVAAETAGMDPALLAGLACFLGGLVVLSGLAAVWYWRQKTHELSRRARSA